MYCEFNGMIGWGIQLEMILYYFDDSKAQMDRKRGIWTCCLEKMDHGTYKYMQAHLKKPTINPNLQTIQGTSIERPIIEWY